MAPIYRKTAKGVAEIETRAHRLPPRLRSALIVVDGRRNAEELRKLMLPPVDDTLAALLEQGFIEVVAMAAAAVVAPARPAPGASAAPAASAASQPADFESRRRDAVRRLTDLVGPMGEALAIRMERTRNAEELHALIGVALQIIGNTRGRQSAADFAARFSDLAGPPPPAAGA